jgi:hypothetical protein
MRTLLLLILIPAACFCQGDSPGNGNKRESTTDSSMKEYQGCVIRSGGDILLTTPANVDFKLSGAPGSLDRYVGDEVKVTASQTAPDNAGSPAADATAGNTKQGPQTIEVAEITKIAERCSSPHEENLPRNPSHP